MLPSNDGLILRSGVIALSQANRLRRFKPSSPQRLRFGRAIQSVTLCGGFRFNRASIDPPTREPGISPMKTRKELEKRIRKLKERLAKGTRKLAKLNAKLKSAPAESGESTKKGRRATTVSKKRAPPKPKRKLNISPERRAQLAAVMNARWAAKRAAAAQAAQSNPPLQQGTDATAGPSEITG